MTEITVVRITNRKISGLETNARLLKAKGPPRVNASPAPLGPISWLRCQAFSNNYAGPGTQQSKAGWLKQKKAG